MKIYESTVAPNPRRVRVFLAEKGITIPYEQVDLEHRANRNPEFRKKSPLGTLPVLELDNGMCIAESMAICRYFEALQPEPYLFGRTPHECGLIEMWNRYMEFNLFGPITDTIKHQHPYFKERNVQVPEYAAMRREETEQMVEWLDGAIGDEPFIAGDDFSVADITALCALDFAKLCKITIKPHQQNLSRWHSAVAARPSAKA